MGQVQVTDVLGTKAHKYRAGQELRFRGTSSVSNIYLVRKGTYHFVLMTNKEINEVASDMARFGYPECVVCLSPPPSPAVPSVGLFSGCFF